MMRRSYIFVLAALLLLSSCSEDFPYDVAGLFSPNGETVATRFQQSQAYNDSVGVQHLDMGSDDYIAYVCSDSHITRTTHANLDTFVSVYNAETHPKIAFHLGDLIDAQNNFACVDSVLGLANGPMMVTLGNHDIYFKQWTIFRSYFHTSAYWFDTYNGPKKLDLFICLDSAEGTLGTEQTQWLKKLLAAKSQEGYRHIIVYTHTHFWKLDNSQEYTSNFALEETYDLATLFAQYGVEAVWSGHQHARQAVLFKGVQYMVTDATKDQEKGQSYMTAQIGDEVHYQYISF